jgi:phosphatidylinositol phospholipase C delta
VFVGSYKEFKAQEALTESFEECQSWIAFNETHLTRIYPNNTRVDSSNYDPYIGWGIGSQLVALNTQTADVALILNQGLFRRNGGCGYVLKPEYLLNPLKEPPAKLKLTIRVISGQNLSAPVDDFVDTNLFVQVFTHGVSTAKGQVLTEGKKQSQIRKSTACVKGNSFNPVWNEGFEFIVDCPDLTQIVFRVLNEAVDGLQQAAREMISGLNINTELMDDVVAAASCPVADLRSGYRNVQLYDSHGMRQGHYAFASLFVYISLTNIV